MVKRKVQLAKVGDFDMFIRYLNIYDRFYATSSGLDFFHLEATNLQKLANLAQRSWNLKTTPFKPIDWHLAKIVGNLVHQACFFFTKK